jgi:hypothetical protein
MDDVQDFDSVSRDDIIADSCGSQSGSEIVAQSTDARCLRYCVRSGAEMRDKFFGVALTVLCDVAADLDQFGLGLRRIDDFGHACFFFLTATALIRARMAA